MVWLLRILVVLNLFSAETRLPLSELPSGVTSCLQRHPYRRTASNSLISIEHAQSSSRAPTCLTGIGNLTLSHLRRSWNRLAVKHGSC
ncbi:hypothetical protein BDW74DRAFT_120036 [Aspergillus multicolor]|uniref:uncharacterized protein n=1 Tax=Aspergillus multicolor TaxID=41759 RepID=UPI003CCD3D9B